MKAFIVRESGRYEIWVSSPIPDSLRVYRNRVRLLTGHDQSSRRETCCVVLEPQDLIEVSGEPPVGLQIVRLGDPT